MTATLLSCEKKRELKSAHTLLTHSRASLKNSLISKNSVTWNVRFLLMSQAHFVPPASTSEPYSPRFAPPLNGHAMTPKRHAGWSRWMERTIASKRRRITKSKTMGAPGRKQ